jgi:uncharacterized membrane protein
VTWGLALAGGWNAAALAFLLTTWSIIIRADSSRAPQLAARDDQTEGFARVLLIGAAVLTVVLSWAVIYTVYTARPPDPARGACPRHPVLWFGVVIVAGSVNLISGLFR